MLHANASERSFWLFTRYVFGLWLARSLLYQIEDLDVVPIEYLAPVGILHLLSDDLFAMVFSRPVLLGLRAALILSCTGALFRRSFHICAIVACLLLTLEQSIVRCCSSHMNHAEVVLLWSAYVVTGYSFFVRRGDTDAPGAALATVAFLMSLTYFFVGITRLVYGNWELFATDTLRKFIVWNAYQPWHIDTTWGQEVIDSPTAMLILNVGFIAITFTEVLAPLALFHRFFRVIFLLSMIGFHIGVIVLMRISFTENLFLLVIFTNFTKYFPNDGENGTRVSDSNHR